MSSFKSLLVSFLILAAINVAAVALNPTPEQHRAQIKADMAQRSPLASLLGLGSLTAFTSNYRSLGVASYTMVKDQMVSVGAFGMVLVMTPE